MSRLHRQALVDDAIVETVQFFLQYIELLVPVVFFDDEQLASLFELKAGFIGSAFDTLEDRHFERTTATPALLFGPERGAGVLQLPADKFALGAELQALLLEGSFLGSERGA